MKGFYYSTFLLATISISNVLTKSNPCRFVQDNVFINDPSSCSGYFKCVDGKAISNKCPGDFWFDKFTGQCNYQSEVECDIIDIKNPCKDACNNKENECFVNNPKSCAGYYYCKDGVGEEGECPPGLNFDPTKLECVYKSDYKCTDDGTLPTNVCENIPNNIFVRDYLDCSKYYRCISGKAHGSFKCEADAYFNLKTATCDYKEEVECEIHEVSCEDKADGYFVPDSKKCSGWHRCLKGKTDLSGNCDKNQWFYEKEQSCEWSYNVPEEVCPNRCEDKPSGFVVKPKTECKEYYNCKNGQINGDAISCGTDKVFASDIEHCITKTDDFKCIQK